MHKDFLNKLIEHGNRQLVEVLILVNQSDKTVSVLFVLLEMCIRDRVKAAAGTHFGRKANVFCLLP